MQLTKHWATTLDDYVIDLEWSPGGPALPTPESESTDKETHATAILAAASAAGPISLFAVADGGLLHVFAGHENGTNCLAWQPVAPTANGGRQTTEGSGQTASDSGAGSRSSAVRRPPPAILATGGQDGAVKFWDATAGQHIATAKLGSAWVEHLAWRPQNRTAEGSRPATEEKGRTTESEPDGSTSVLRPPPSGPRSPSALLAAAAGRNLFFLRTDASTAHAFKPTPKTITALAFQPAGGSAAVAFFGGVCLWDADDFLPQKEFPYGNGIQTLAWSPDNRWLVSGNQDPSVHLWIPEEDIELHMSGYEGKVRFLSFDHTSRWLATSGGREACIWDCAGAGPEGREPAMLPHGAPVCAVKFQNTHGLLATAAQDGVIQLWSPERRQPLRATVRMPTVPTKLAWSSDDRYLAIGSEKGGIYVLKCEA